MEPKILMKPYCLIGLGDNKGIKEDLKFIAETDSNFVCGDGLIIATFMSTLRIIEMEEFFKMNDRSFILFELTPGFFAANIENPQLQKALFGGIPNISRNWGDTMEDGLIEFMKNIKRDLEEDSEELISIKPTLSPDPTLDEILDKINEIGVAELTTKEKELLQKYSN